MRERDPDIDQLFEGGQELALASYLQLLHHTDIAQLFDFVDKSNWERVTAQLPPEELAQVLADLEQHHRESIGEVLGVERLSEAVGELETDDAADVLADLSDAQSEAVLRRLEDKDEIATLLAFPEDSAGGIMQTELCRVQGHLRVEDAIDAVREAREEVDDLYDVYLVDQRGVLLGTVDLEDLVLARPQENLDSLRQDVEIQVSPDEDQEEVARLFAKYDVAAVPVVDGEGKLLGRITFDDVHDVLVEEASEDILAMAGASGEDLVYRGPAVRVALYRLPWLLSSLLGSLITTQLVPLFSVVPGDALVLAAFVPVMMAMTGNVGSQSAMIITRGLAIGKVSTGGLGRILWREAKVGLLMGGVAGVVVGLFGLWTQGDGRLGLALGIAMVTSMTAATLVGVSAPVMFRRFGIDPAIAAGPLVTTGCDVLGVSIYLLVAVLALAG